MAAALLRRRLETAGVPGSVSSAGLLTEGVPASPGAVKAMQARDIELGSHRSAVLDEATLADADLVLGMAREHVREAVVLLPEAWPRSFTLKELVRRGSEAGRRGAHERMADWLDRSHEGRDTAALMGSSTEDDIVDPIGMSDAAYEDTATELDGLLEQLVNLVWGARTRAPEKDRNLAAR